MMNGIILALGGGGVRGFAHLGVLQVLSEQGVPVRALAGSSAGALAAATYAFGLPLEPGIFLKYVIDRRLTRLVRNDGSRLRRLARLHFGLFKAMRRLSLASNDRMRQGLVRLFGKLRIEDSPIPLAIVATDLCTRKMVILQEGPLVDALLASAAIPGVFPPVRWGEHLLVDGDFSEKVPVTAARQLWNGPILAVDVSNSPEIMLTPHTAFDVIFLASLASRERLRQLALEQADLVLALRPNDPIETFDYHRTQEVYQLGIQRAEALLPQVQALLAPEPLEPIAPKRGLPALWQRFWQWVRPGKARLPAVARPALEPPGESG